METKIKWEKNLMYVMNNFIFTVSNNENPTKTQARSSSPVEETYSLFSDK